MPDNKPRSNGRRRMLGQGVGSRTGRAATPTSDSALARLLFGLDPPPLDGIAEIAPGEINDAPLLDHESVVWTGYLATPPDVGSDADSERVGICCSGGGIRAASFSVGGLDALRSRGIFGRAAQGGYLAGVSGGGYIAIAHAALRGLTRKYSGSDADQLLESPAPWAMDAPEMVNLRNHTRYLVPNLAGGIWALAVIAYGLVRHLIPFAALVVVLGTIYGWILLALPHVNLSAGATRRIDLASVAWVGVACGLCLALAALLVALRLQQRVAPPAAGWRIGLSRTLALALIGAGAAGTAIGINHVDAFRITSGALSITVTVALAFVVVAAVQVGWRALSRWLSGCDRGRAFLETWSVRLCVVAAATGALLCGIPVALTHIPELHPVALLGTLGGDLLAGASLRRIARYARTAPSSRWTNLVVAVASYVIGPLVVAVALFLMTYVAVTAGLSIPIAIALVGAVACWLFAWLLSDEVRSPLHILYRERLAGAFIRYRFHNKNVAVGTGEPPWKDAVSLTELNMDGMPNLIICAAVNVCDDVVPPGRFAGSFTFEKERSGGPLTGYVATAALEKAAGEGVLTLPGMMAVSGAAFSPIMGRFTRPGFRLLLSMFDVRLGLWLPNPRWIRGVETARRMPMAWPPPGAPLGKRFADGDDGAKTPAEPLRAGWSYNLREAFGLNSLRLPYVYVTDGGHWDNLGIVELLRRGCTRIVCFDASEDGDSTPLRALGQAMALARDELSVDFDVASDTTAALIPGSAGIDSNRRAAKSITAKVEFRYPNGRGGVLVVAKNVLPVDAPRDVLAYAAVDKAFPSDTTLNQFFDDEHFDAYRELGYVAGLRAADLLRECERDFAGGRNSRGAVSGGASRTAASAGGGLPAPQLSDSNKRGGLRKLVAAILEAMLNVLNRSAEPTANLVGRGSRRATKDAPTGGP